VQGPMGNLHLRGHSLLPGNMGGERGLFLQHSSPPGPNLDRNSQMRISMIDPTMQHTSSRSGNPNYAN
jgi:hypothetical protein